MPKFRVMYQSEPFHYTDGIFCEVEAKDRVDAYLATYNKLAARGVNTAEAFPGNCREPIFSPEEFEQLKASGLPYEGYPCKIHILQITPLFQAVRS